MQRKTTEFTLAQQKMVVCQLGEQIGMLEKENEEKAKLLTLYKQEVGRLSELTELGSKTAEKEELLGEGLRGRLAPSGQLIASRAGFQRLLRPRSKWRSTDSRKSSP